MNHCPSAAAEHGLGAVHRRQGDRDLVRGDGRFPRRRRVRGTPEHHPVPVDAPGLAVEGMQEHPVATPAALQGVEVGGGAGDRVGCGGEVDVRADRGHRAAASRERRAEQRADGAVAAVAGDEEGCPHRPAAGERGRDPVVVLGEPGQAAAPPDGDTVLAQPRLEDRRQPVLRHEHAVGVPGAPWASVEGHRQAGEMRAGPVPRDLMGSDRVDEAAHRQHLGRPGADPAAPGLRARLVVPLDEDDVGPGEGQLGASIMPVGPAPTTRTAVSMPNSIPSAEIHPV